MNKRRNKKVDGQKIFSIVASLAIVAALVAGLVSVIKNNTKDKKRNYIDLNVVENQTPTDAQNREKETKYIVVERPTETEAKETEAETEPVKEANASVSDSENETIEVNAPVFSFTETSRLTWPVVGDVLLGFNMDNTIYFPTLDVYRCNPAIMITVPEGTEVRSAAAGIVEEVYVDNETGTTMKIAIGNGYELTYGQLTDVKVGISDVIEPGAIIGKIAAPTKYFTKEGSNLYFKLTKDGIAIDPMLYLGDEKFIFFRQFSGVPEIAVLLCKEKNSVTYWKMW